MRLEDYIRTDEYGERFVAGHRVPILSVLRAHIERGMDGRRLAQRFPSLSLEEVYGVLAYYYRSRAEVDQYLIDTEAEIRRQEEEFWRTYTGPTREELCERLRAKQTAEQARLAS